MLPNFRAIFTESRTTEEQRAVSNAAVFKLVTHLLLIAAFNVLRKSVAGDLPAPPSGGLMGSASMASLAAFLPPLPDAPGTVLITDDIRADGFPFLHHFLAQSCAADVPASTALVSFSHPRSHYEAVARKLGYTLRPQSFLFIDAIPLIPLMTIPAISATSEPIAKNQLAQLESHLAAIVANTTSGTVAAGSTLFIDDASSLTAMGIPATDVFSFIATSARRLFPRVVVLLHTDSLTAVAPQAVHALADLADCVVEARGLDSGFSEHASGRVRVLSRSSGGDESRDLLFLVSESAVRVWAPGNR
ncbi:hypothetical protein HDU82_004978 [Entophlyctis luteolus]|nr:hypothetical protein HDU82_004978 [Entophlyctis luteolus]